MFYEIELTSSFDRAEKSEVLKQLNNRRSKLNLNSPQIPKWAFKLARMGILEDESYYKVDKDIL